MATIREITKQSNVFIGTVSFVLNGKAGQMRIVEKIQQKVLEAVKKLGCNPSLSTRRLQTKEEKEVPVIVYQRHSNKYGTFSVDSENRGKERDSCTRLVSIREENVQ